MAGYGEQTEPVVEVKPEERSKLIKVIRAHPGMGGDSAIVPEDYLSASGEGLFAMMVTSWIIAYFFSYENIQKNPLKDMLGYNNVCVAWDVPPALYVAPVMFGVPLYCALRYAVTDYDRYALCAVESGSLRAKRIINAVYSISVCATVLIFVITPTVHANAHTLLFCQLIFFRFVVVASAFVLVPPEVEVSRSQLVFLTVYGLVSVSLLLVFMINMYISPGGWLRSHWIISQTVDLAWFVCLPLTTKFMPYQGHIEIDRSVSRRRQSITSITSNGGIPYGQVSEDPEARAT